MILVAGLGNPGEKYQKSRHNTGFLVVEALARQFIAKEWENESRFDAITINDYPTIILAKPQTFMNLSGEPVARIINFYKIPLDNLWVIHDDLDIKLGEYKIQKGKGPKDHNGLISLYQNLGSNSFWHVRIGVDNRDPKHKLSGESYVLRNFDQEELLTLNKVIENVVIELINNLNI